MTDKETEKKIEIPALLVSQPIGDFFIGTMNWDDLCAISDFDIRRILKEKRDVETYLGIQRPLNQTRVKEIQQYVNTVDATFPTGVILAVEEEAIEYDRKRGTVILKNYMEPEEETDRIYYRQIARVLDGQHRIEGLKNFSGEIFQINVIIFVGTDIADQANVFATVNLAQTRVNPSLAYDLYELAKTRSPQKTCHEIVVALDSSNGSPFYRRIKRLGVATEGRQGERITQANFVKMLLPYISRDPMGDRDQILKKKKLELVGQDESEELIFRNMFIENRDLDIAETIWNYFDAVKQRWPIGWEEAGRGHVLTRSTGFRGFMRFLRPAYLYCTAPGTIVENKKFLAIFEKINLKDDDFSVERFKPGTGGETALYQDLMARSGLQLDSD